MSITVARQRGESLKKKHYAKGFDKVKSLVTLTVTTHTLLWPYY